VASRRKKKTQRERWDDPPTPSAKEEARREAAFAAIRALYAEVLPLWRSCARGYCRRHKICAGEARACVKRTWPQLPQETRAAAFDSVKTGGPRRVPPRTGIELQLRRFPPSNFVH